MVDDGEEFGDEVRAIIRVQEIWHDKFVHPVPPEAISREGHCLFLQGVVLVRFMYLSVMTSENRFPESVFGRD